MGKLWRKNRRIGERKVANAAYTAARSLLARDPLLLIKCVRTLRVTHSLHHTTVSVLLIRISGSVAQFWLTELFCVEVLDRQVTHGTCGHARILVEGRYTQRRTFCFVKILHENNLEKVKRRYKGKARIKNCKQFISSPDSLLFFTF